jgi:hypothetical protein
MAGLTALGVAIAGAQGDETARGTDPLSATELEAAAALARGSNPGEAAGLGDDDVVLLVERHEEPKDAADGLRRADVFVYSYDDDVLTHNLVDLASDEVLQSRPITGEQLPLVEEEEARALEIALADADFEQLLATRFRQGTGRDLVDPATDLKIDAMVFSAATNPAAARGAAARCGEHRCAQLLIRSSDDLLVNLLPVVDLSADRLVSREGFFR